MTHVRPLGLEVSGTRTRFSIQARPHPAGRPRIGARRQPGDQALACRGGRRVNCRHSRSCSGVRDGAVDALTASRAIADGQDRFELLRRCAADRAGRRELSARADRWRAAGCLTARARCWPPRWPPAGTLLMPRSEHMPHSYNQNEQVHEGGREEQQDYCARGIALGIRRPWREERERPYACIKRGRHREHRARPQNWLLALGPDGLGRLSRDRLDGEVGGEGGQLRVGPRRERLAHPLVEFVLGQNALHERGLEGADHLLAVGVGRAEVTAARACCGCHLISRSCHHGASPNQRDAAKRNPRYHRLAIPAAARPGTGWVRCRRSARPGWSTGRSRRGAGRPSSAGPA